LETVTVIDELVTDEPFERYSLHLIVWEPLLTLVLSQLAVQVPDVEPFGPDISISPEPSIIYLTDEILWSSPEQLAEILAALPETVDPLVGLVIVTDADEAIAADTDMAITTVRMMANSRILFFMYFTSFSM
jgi:hypothetical protein